MDKVFDTFDAADVHRRFAEAGVFDILTLKGFRRPAVEIASDGQALPHVYVSAEKNDRRHLLIEACVTTATVRPSFFLERGFAMEAPAELVVAYWLREQDPTRVFQGDRPPLPLQRHPGLGTLRQAFHVITGMAAELGKDGVACMPKFFHDALIFYRSRLFLFLDPLEQARFEVILRDLGSISLRDLSLALLTGAISDQHGVPVLWRPGYQVFPLSQRLTAYFNSPMYEAMVTNEAANYRVTHDPGLSSTALECVGPAAVGELVALQRHQEGG